MDQSDDARYYAAAAYQSERVRRAANNLAGWTVAYLKNKDRDRDGAHAAYQFAEATVTLAGVLVWNEIEVSHVGPMARDAAGIALAWDVVHEIPTALDAAYRFSDGNPSGMAQSDCVELAKQHATVELAKDCLEVCRLIPDRFSGPDGEARFKASREIWRDLHGVQSEPPATLDEVLRSALIIPPSPTTGQQKPTTEAPAAPETTADTDAATVADLPSETKEGAQRAKVLEAWGKLTESQRSYLDAALELGAVDEEHRTTTEKIAKRAGYNAETGNIRHALQTLRQLGYFASKRGPKGGTWLTELGRRVVESGNCG